MGDHFSQMFSFEGRIRRGTFWAFTFLELLFLILFTVFMYAAALVLNDMERTGVALFDEWFLGGSWLALIGCIYLIGASWAGLAVYTRRWHDVGMSGWMNLLLFIPVVNLFIVLGLGMTPGNKGSNKYGEEPLHAPSTTSPLSS